MSTSLLSFTDDFVLSSLGQHMQAAEWTATSPVGGACVSPKMHGHNLSPPTLETCEEDPSTTPFSNSNQISEQDFSCHCCFDVLVNPTTLTCGHNYCRHCLALWWESSRKNECPECRQRWEGFPKVNTLLRAATDKLFSEVVQRRRAEIQDDPKISRILLAFERYGDNLGKSRTKQNKVAGFVFSAVIAVLFCVVASLLLYQWSSSRDVAQEELFVSRSALQWTPAEMILWLETVGPELSRKSFQSGSPSERLLMLLEEKELLKPPYHLQNQAYRHAILSELYRLQAIELRPQNLWEYKAVNSGKSLFLLYAMKRSPRLTLFYLYLFDYSETFLPFLRTCCSSIASASQPVESLPFNAQMEPNWQQWSEFMVKYFLLPYQLIAEFAWDWLSVHYWTSLFVIVHAMLLSMLECCSLWRLCTTARIRSLPDMMWNHVWTMFSQGLAFGLMWPLVPQLVCNCLFYWALYVSPLMNIELLVRQLRHRGTAVH
ncbi:bifunctional apoptosis regulator-like [Hippocampus zosterae]|uniref:bifunctional apoptosis regulator-like n=1 Tax=Hippocampus zosterae TaxID=109293 RepID=UPI00223E614E|nr:bifunctional apoptosis regulator-like [Hippocampus zosterae]